jgi:hypothetical protein
MKKVDCPSFEILVDYVLGSLPAQQLPDLQAHLEQCASCQPELSQIQELIGHLEEDAKIEVSQAAHQKALALFRPWIEAQPKPAGFLRRLAKLVFDSGPQPGQVLPQVAGLRTAEVGFSSAGSLCQLLFSVDEGQIEVDLQIRAAQQNGKFNLIGQVLGTENRAERVQLTATQGEIVLESEPDETYTFRFQNVPEGEYSLIFQANQEIIEVSSIKL